MYNSNLNYHHLLMYYAYIFHEIGHVTLQKQFSKTLIEFANASSEKIKNEIYKDYLNLLASIYFDELSKTVTTPKYAVLKSYNQSDSVSTNYSNLLKKISLVTKECLTSKGHILEHKQPEIKLTKEQIKHIESDLNIKLNDYSKSNSANNKKIFTIDNLLALIGILIAICAMIQTQIQDISNNKNSSETSEKISQIIEFQKNSNRSIEQIEIQNDEIIEQLTKQQEKTNELLEAILEQLTENDDDN